MLPNTPAMYEAHFGVPMSGAVLNTLNTRLDAEAHRLHARARRGEGADHRPRVLADDRGGARASSSVKTARDRRRRNTRVPAASASARPTTRAFLAERRSRVRLAAARATSGTRSRSTTPRAPPATRRASSTTTAAPTSTRVCNIVDLGHAAARGVPVDAADVPLQRLVLSVDHGGATPAPTSACARSRPTAIFDADPRAQGHALLRRADRARHADQRARGAEAGHRPQGAWPWSPARRRRRR